MKTRHESTRFPSEHCGSLLRTGGQMLPPPSPIPPTVYDLGFPFFVYHACAINELSMKLLTSHPRMHWHRNTDPMSFTPLRLQRLRIGGMSLVDIQQCLAFLIPPCTQTSARQTELLCCHVSDVSKIRIVPASRDQRSFFKLQK